MAWFDRFSTLMKADAHGVIDALEDRALMLRQHLREAREAVEQKRVRLAGLEAERRDAQAESQRLEEQLETLEADVDLAMAEGQDDLARFAVKKLLPRRAQAQRVERRLGELAEERDRLVDTLAEQEAAFEDLEQRIKARLAQLDSGGSNVDPDEWVVRDEDVEFELLRRRQTTAAAEGGA